MFLRRRVSSSRINNRIRLNSKRLWLQPLESREVPATFTVTNTNDATVLAGGDLPGSLRQAIFDANANPGADTIVFSGVTGTLNMSPGTGNFVINGAVTIIGPGASNFTIDAGKLSRHFYISDDTDAQISVSISGMTLTNGAAQLPSSPGSPPYESGAGGSIYVRNDILTLDGMHITGNSAALNYSGGAIAMGAGGVPSQFNTGFGSSLTITNSVLDYNVSNSTGGGGNGGGAIYFNFPNNNSAAAVGNFFSISNSTISNNTAGNRGGGIYFSGNAGGQLGSSFSMRNTTVSGNRSFNGFAGGVLISSTTGLPMSIVNSTIANNVAMTTPGGGGLSLNTGTGTINIENSIIADNTGPSTSPDFLINSAATIVSKNNIFGNLAGISPSVTLTNLGTIIGSAKLAPLANNGGTTLTMLPAYNSPAINSTNSAITTAASAAGIGATTVTVASATGIVPGSFIGIDSEIAQIASISGTTITFTAALAQAHLVGAPVTLAQPVQTAISQPAAVGVGDTTIGVASPLGVTPGTSLQIDSEIVRVSSIGTSTLTNVITPLTTSTTSATVVSAAGLTTGAFVQVDAEIMQVTAITNIATTLSAAITSTTATTISVTNATGIAANMFLLIDSEYVLVNAVSGTNLSVARAQFGSSGATHLSGAAVTASVVTLSRGLQGTSANAHNSGASLVRNVLNVVRAQNSTVAATHNVGQAMMIAFDQRGVGFPRRLGGFGDIGAVEVNPATPAAIATVSNITTPGAATGTFTVTYSSSTGIDVSTVIGNNTAIRVTGPGGFDVPATYVSIDNGTNGSPRTATYTFAAPTGTWDYLDNGTYQINILANKVFDTGATAISATTVGQFTAAIGRSLVVTDASNFGPNTLRDMVEQANANAFAVDTITFDTVTMGTSTITLASVIDITDPIFINGPGVTIDGGSSTRLFHTSGPGNMAVTFQGLALNNGTVPFIITDPNIGSAVLADDDNITLINCTLTGNTAGAVASYAIITSGFINVQSSKFLNNNGPGVILGGFPTQHDFAATNSTFDGNKGPAITGRAQSFNLNGVTISNNSNSGRGGGIAVVGNFNSNGVSIINSTISGNTAGTGGGGIYMYWANTSGRVLIANTTIANNVALAGFQNEQGGGLLNKAKSNYLLDLENTVIAGNSNSTVPDFSSASTVIANNSFIGVYQSLNGKVVGLNNKLGSKAAPLDAFLGPLANNGGPTQTMMPYAGSPLIDVSATVPSLSTLSFPLNSTSTSFAVAKPADLTNFVTNTYVQIDSEIMFVTGAAMTNQTPITVALTAGGTTANVQNPNVLAVNQYLQLESELVQVTAINNTALTTLSAAITSTTATSITVTSATGIATGMFLLIDAEYVRVTAIAGTTLTVTRGQNGTTAATHLNGASVGTPTITILRGQLGTTAAAHAALIQLQAPIVSVGNSLFGTSFRGQLGTTAVAHTTGSVVTIGYTQPTNDQRGAGFPRAVNGKVDIGAVEVDPNIPSAVLTSPLPQVTTSGQTPYVISVTFADNVAMNAATIFNNNNVIRVTGPNGFNSLATFVSIDNNTNGSPRVATYSINAPGGSWDVSENGIYSVTIEPNQVADTSGNFVEAHKLGQFQVAFTLSLVVTNNNDSGPGSLRDAIEQTNANAGINDTITFDATYFSTPRTITLFGGELVVADAVTIVGPGAKFATLEGFDSRIFTIDSPLVQQPISISGLTMTKGNSKTALTTGVTDGGGAILNLDEALTINGCVITANSATQSSISYGGGILLGNALATLTLQNSTLSNNVANADGGGIAIRYGCLVTIDGTTISGNTAGASSPSSTAGGGGISAALGVSSGTTPTPTVTLNNSILSNNVAPSGGGVRVANGVSNSRPSFFSATNTTFYGNVATGSSTSTGNGGALTVGTSVNLMVQNCTISGNYAKGQGGGVFLPNFNANYGINGGFVNTVIAGNVAKTSPDVGGSNGTTTTFTLPFVNSFVGAVDLATTKINNIGGQFGTIAAPLNAMLAPLATTNGGPTNTVMPLPGSPLINAGTTTPSVLMTFVGSTSVTLSATTIALTTSNPMQVGSFIQIDSEIMQVTAISSPNITVTRGALSTVATTHNAGAAVLRANVPAPTANDQRGAGYPRQIGTIDIGAVEVDPAIPVASGSFTKVTAPSVGSHTIAVTYTDDVAMNLASIQ
ncbi:MAG: hypothetical protein K1X57_13790, partial [Gemmataceae bacterium]|nr:hypothetical protein [Gemmataceae bacterium]